MKYFVVVIALLATFAGWSQVLPFQFKGRVSNTDNGGNEGGVTIAAVQNGSTILSTTSASNGKYNLVCEINYTQPFEIVYSKPGLVTKKLSFDFSKMNEEDVPPGNVRPAEELDIDLFAERPNVNFDFLENEPVAKFDWDTRNLSPRLDRAAVDAMKKRIADLLEEAESAEEELEKNYQDAITAADAAYNNENWEEALGKYEEALGYKPNEKYPSDRIVELDALIQAQKDKELAEAQNQTEYDNLIASADQLRDQEKLKEAVSRYQEASSKKPSEQYPKDQIAALNAKIEQIEKEKAAQEAYDSAIEKADMFLKQNSLKAARDKYQEASELKPSEQYPKDKLAEIDGKMEEAEAAAEKKQKYNDALAAADAAFDTEDYQTAKAKYEEALTYEPSSSYAKGRLAICDEKLKDILAEIEKQKQIEELLKAGQDALDKNEFDSAIGKYDEVLGLEETNEIAKEKKVLAEKLKAEAAELAEQEQQFNDLVAQGDNAVGAENFEEAISKYEEALTLKTDAAVQTKLDDAKAQLQAQKDLAEKSAEFQKLIDEANDLMSQEKLQDARAKFEEAAKLDATSDIPPTKIKEIDDILADQEAGAEKQKKYEDAIAEADKFFDKEKWSESKAKYEEALTFASDPSYANGRIEEINIKISENEELAERQAKYEEAIAAADKAFAAETWDDAKAKYNEAKTFTEDPSYADEQLSKIEAVLADQQAAQEQKAQIEGLLAEGEELYNGDKLEDAKAKYEEVLGLDSKNQTAKDQIAKINNDLAALKSEAEKDAEFLKLKEEGFQLADNEEYDKAKSKLEEALSLKEDSEVQKKIDEINNIQSDKNEVASLIMDGEAFLGDNKYEQAKQKFEAALAKDSDNQEAKEGLAKAEEEIENQNALASQEEQFNKLKEEGLQLKDQEKYDDAKAKLNDALNIQDDNEIREALEQIRVAQEANLVEAEKEAKYQDLIDEGDNLGSSGKFDEAINKYKEAKNMKPSSSEPDEKIAAIEAKIKDIAEQEEIDKKYDAQIEKGDQLVREEKYLEAIDAYNKALEFKPTEQLPVDKAKKAEELAKNSKTDADKAVEKNLTIAAQKIEEGDYDRGTEILNSTQNLGPGPERLAEIEDLRQRIVDYKKRDAEYDKLMSSAQKSYDKEKYEAALEDFRAANKLKENEPLPKEKIDEIEAILDEMASSEQRDKLYNDYMTKGEDHLTNQKYELALSDFQNALEAKKGDADAKAKINEVQQILDDLANQSEADRELKNKFNAIIGEADMKFNTGEYLPAKAKYEEALALIPTDEYAQNRVEECVKREREISDKLEEQQYQKLLEAADKNFAEENYEKAKERYNTAVGLRSNDPYPKKKLAEIEAILNPASVQSMKLEDPGVPIEGSILDGQALLQQAQQERDAFEKQKLQNKMDQADEEISELNAEKTQDREDSRLKIATQYQNAEIYADGANMQHDKNAELIHKGDNELADVNRENSKLDYNINLSDQTQLDVINEKSALNYGERTDVYMDNAGTMDAYEKALDEAFKAQADSDYGSSIASDQKLIASKKTIQSEMIDDFEERDKVRQDVNDISQAVAKADAELNQEDYNVNHVAKQKIENVYSNVDSKTTEDVKKSHDNNESLVVVIDKINNTSDDLGSSETVDNYEAKAAINNIVINYDSKAEMDAKAISKNGEDLRSIDNRINEKGIAMNREETEFAYSADRQMEGYKEKTRSDLSGMDENRKETVEVLKEGNKELAAANEGIQDRNHEKSLNNKLGIDKETATNNKKIVEQAEETQAINVAGMKYKANKASNTFEEEKLSDEQERLGAQKGITDEYERSAENTNESTQKQAQNKEVLENSKRVIDAETGDRGDANQDKVYGAANAISKIDNKPQEKVVVSNSLGEEYPEGVTEESFAQNDQNGLMKAIITRRIVVINGHADVYQRTQSLNAITYSKNGKPITEHDWNSNTQGPHLERHTK